MARSERPKGDQLVVRFTKGELLQHWVLLISLTILALTGLSLFAHDTWLGRWLMALEGGMETRGVIHRIFAVVLMGLVAWHWGYVLFSERGNQLLRAMVWKKEDFRQTKALFAYYFGRQPSLPDFGRFTPMQKLQYWGAGIGALLMIATGLVLWFHTQALAVVPKWFLDVTAIVHGYEGLLLFGLLFLWHLYIVHLSPGNFPMQKTFLTGKITAAQLWREHRAEYRQLFGDQPPEGVES